MNIAAVPVLSACHMTGALQPGEGHLLQPLDKPVLTAAGLQVPMACTVCSTAASKQPTAFARSNAAMALC